MLSERLTCTIDPESTGLCSNNSDAINTALLSITFCSGSLEYCNATADRFNFTTNHTKAQNCTNIADGEYCFAKAVPHKHENWHYGSGDHTTNNSGGYMYFVNVGDRKRKIFEATVHNLSVGIRYEFSEYMANVIKQRKGGIDPNIRFEIRNAREKNQSLASVVTGNIAKYEQMTWTKYGLSFNASNHSVILVMTSDVDGNDGGNDLAVDDIRLITCSSQLSANTPTSPLINDSCTCDSTTTTSIATTSTATTSTTTFHEEATTTMPPTTKSNDFTSLATTIVTTHPTTKVVLSSASPLSREHFVGEACNELHYIGTYCNISSSICNMLEPCQNNGSCHNTTISNCTCTCSQTFEGSRCIIDHRPCKTHRCLSNDSCEDGWQGPHCQYMIHKCDTVRCENKGVCRPIPNGFKCECVGHSYGTYCQFIPPRIVILRIVSKSFAYVAIIAMASVAMFVIVMDILKYGFGIDPVKGERERLRQEKQARKRRRPVIQRFVYVDAPSAPAISTSTV